MTKRMRILLVDDHRMVREGLRMLLEQFEDIEVVGEASDGRGALALVTELEPDVVIMDIAMADLNGIEATRRIRAEHEQVRVVALSTHSDRSFVFHMFQAGASAYVLKESAFEELHQALLDVRDGKRYLSPGVAGFEIQPMSRVIPDPRGSSPRP